MERRSRTSEVGSPEVSWGHSMVLTRHLLSDSGNGGRQVPTKVGRPILDTDWIVRTY